MDKNENPALTKIEGQTKIEAQATETGQESVNLALDAIGVPQPEEARENVEKGLELPQLEELDRMTSACNLSGLVMGWARLLPRINADWRRLNEAGENIPFNRHFANWVLADKVCSLLGATVGEYLGRLEVDLVVSPTVLDAYTTLYRRLTAARKAANKPETI